MHSHIERAYPPSRASAEQTKAANGEAAMAGDIRASAA